MENSIPQKQSQETPPIIQLSIGLPILFERRRTQNQFSNASKPRTSPTPQNLWCQSAIFAVNLTSNIIWHYDIL